MIRETIAKLAEGTLPDQKEAYKTMKEIMAGDATPAQIAAYLTALRIRGESAHAIAGSAQAMRENFTAVKAPGHRVVDTCGTGGDGTHTFNISTAAALVTAGAGVTVAKHGNKSVSSKSGSADVLDALGVDIGVAPETMERCLEEVGIAFLFAPSLHPAMKHAIGPRKEIGIRTLFNILGPLSNPAGAQRGVLGVYSTELVDILGDALADLKCEHVFVVHGFDGLDELTTTASSHVAEVRGGRVKRYEVHPEELGLPLADPADLKGGSPEENAAIIRAILDGETGPKRDVVILNAAAAIVAGGGARDLHDGIAQAAAAIEGGQARDKLDALVAATRSG